MDIISLKHELNVMKETEEYYIITKEYCIKNGSYNQIDYLNNKDRKKYFEDAFNHIRLNLNCLRKESELSENEFLLLLKTYDFKTECN